MIKKHCLTVVLLSLVFVFAGCGFESAVTDAVDQVRQSASVQQANDQVVEVRPTSSVPVAVQPRGGETITIASFNIQVFGTSKMKKTHAMDVLTQVVRRYDIVAIQELRSTDQTVIPRFVDMINADGATYDYVLGPRLGRSSSKEQYVYIFDASRIEVDRGSVYTTSDPQDLLHREPLAARFAVRSAAKGQPFTFTLVNIHTDPDDTDIELDALDDAFVSVQQDGSGEDDVILLGDLNVDHKHLGELGQLPNIAWTVHGEKTNTRGTKSYDNIVFNSQFTNEFTGNAGVLNLLTEYGLTKEQALQVSDHMPVWAEFTVEENSGAIVAARNGASKR